MFPQSEFLFVFTKTSPPHVIEPTSTVLGGPIAGDHGRSMSFSIQLSGFALFVRRCAWNFGFSTCHSKSITRATMGPHSAVNRIEPPDVPHAEGNGSIATHRLPAMLRANSHCVHGHFGACRIVKSETHSFLGLPSVSAVFNVDV